MWVAQLVGIFQKNPTGSMIDDIYKERMIDRKSHGHGCPYSRDQRVDVKCL